MPEHSEDDRWRRMHEAAGAVRAALLAVGVPETELNHITGRRNISGQDEVYLGSLSLASAERLLAALAAPVGHR